MCFLTVSNTYPVDNRGIHQATKAVASIPADTNIAPKCSRLLFKPVDTQVVHQPVWFVAFISFDTYSSHQTADVVAFIPQTLRVAIKQATELPPVDMHKARIFLLAIFIWDPIVPCEVSLLTTTQLLQVRPWLSNYVSHNSVWYYLSIQ